MPCVTYILGSGIKPRGYTGRLLLEYFTRIPSSRSVQLHYGFMSTCLPTPSNFEGGKKTECLIEALPFLYLVFYGRQLRCFFNLKSNSDAFSYK